jgi:hypothetical protein
MGRAAAIGALLGGELPLVNATSSASICDEARSNDCGMVAVQANGAHIAFAPAHESL